MVINLILLAVFLACGSAAAWLVWRKIPLLLQVPQNLIQESFVTRPSRLKTYSRPFVDFFKEKRYKDFYYGALVRLLRRIRIVLLKLERLSFHLLQSLQAEASVLSQREEHYWRELRQWKAVMKKNGNSLPEEVAEGSAPPVGADKNSQ